MSINEGVGVKPGRLVLGFKEKKKQDFPIQGILSEVDSDLLNVYEVFVANIIYYLRIN